MKKPGYPIEKGGAFPMKRFLSILLSVTCMLSLVAATLLPTFAAEEEPAQTPAARVGYTVSLIQKKKGLAELKNIKEGLVTGVREYQITDAEGLEVRCSLVGLFLQFTKRGTNLGSLVVGPQQREFVGLLLCPRVNDIIGKIEILLDVEMQVLLEVFHRSEGGLRQESFYHFFLFFFFLDFLEYLDFLEHLDDIEFFQFLEYDGQESHGMSIECAHAVGLCGVKVDGVALVEGEHLAADGEFHGAFEHHVEFLAAV